MLLGGQHKVAQVFEPLPPTWETGVEFLAPDLGLADVATWKKPLDRQALSLSLPFSNIVWMKWKKTNMLIRIWK